MKTCSVEYAKRNWKTWLLAAGVMLVPALAFAAEHASQPGCSCPLCSLVR
jgi:hypothetical protein